MSQAYSGQVKSQLEYNSVQLIPESQGSRFNLKSEPCRTYSSADSTQPALITVINWPLRVVGPQLANPTVETSHLNPTIGTVLSGGLDRLAVHAKHSLGLKTVNTMVLTRG